jgi:alcohol dehydrogenase class IV
MNLLKKIYCRTFQGIMKLVLPMMPYREPEILESVTDIPNVLMEKQITNVLVVTDNSIVELGLTKALNKALRENKIKFEVFSDVVPNPTTDCIEKAVEMYNTNGCSAIIAVGGGSVIDCAKGVGARVANPKKTLIKMKGLLKVKGDVPLTFAIPTTAGTGSETTVSAVITHSDTHHKFVINDFDLIPSYAVLDANLTTGLPLNLTVTTGLDALTHAIEAFIGNATTETTRKNALESARLIFENLPRVCEDGKNVRARSQMLRASYLAGLAFTRSYVGYVHAIAHSLGGKYGTPHGLANAVILPYVLSEYGSTIYKKIKTMAVYCNIARPYDNDQLATSKFINKLIEINETYGIPKTFDFIQTQDIPTMASLANKEANPLYPVPKLMNARELEKIYYKIKA